VLSKGDLTAAFQTYWEDMRRCETGGAYWCLLHIVVCLPDICAALRASNGETNREKYIPWCDEYLQEHRLTGAERYRMRCKVLHQGRSSTDQPGRYSDFSFGSPSTTGQRDHLRADGATLHLDVSELAREYKSAVSQWSHAVESNPGSSEAQAVAKNLPALVRVRPVQVPAPPSAGSGGGGTTTIFKTN
jgi:hypothetical protein